MAKTHVKFATQVDAEILGAVRTLAKKEGRQIQALVDEALADLIDKRKGVNARSHVMSAYMKSHKTYGQVYEKLAK
ncbi:MAG: hypothetical protein COA96_12430 [SAR86 cluster bacterium]|uniref:Ribbon-helix-helix protein CopG domain-containing protein n=1 Tax=SAR86 cluster bacterium TaxID=2030880 RepID=A0A2A5AVB8_9GAMM|nr:MAG: hypothetical protein COA96_12430 [SAR86 cluster bacterium]